MSGEIGQKPEIRKKTAKDLLFDVKTRINPAIEPIVREFKKALQYLYGDRCAMWYSTALTHGATTTMSRTLIL